MKLTAKNSRFVRYLMVAATAFCGADLYAAQAPNPRGGNVVAQSARGGEHTATARTTASANGTVSRSATARPATTTARAASSNVVNVANTNTTTGRSAVRRNNIVSAVSSVSARAAANNTSRSATNVSRAASSSNVVRSGIVRSATKTSTTSSARSATNVARAGSRAGVARATAVFDDISKIGGGYATCREAYATCMDQFCAKANETYRRCYCSERYTGFRDTQDAISAAKELLAQFEDNNLNAVDKSAAEVNAMYTATVGEQAIKNDTSGAAAILSEIGDLLSGKKKASNSSTSGTSLGIMDLSFSTDLGDIWGDSSGSSSIFGNDNGVDLSTLEGVDLYNQSHKQCLQMIGDSCENSAVTTMAKSSYSILISQDCNAYEKKIDAQVESVKSTVRTAEKYLRDARLEEYRSHNSADVNECIAKVKSAITADTACGVNYKRCLDPTGAYINPSTGDPIYSPRLFKLEDLILLDGEGADVLKQNKDFDAYLETRKMFATTALDSCRDISATVWQEFKRSALIEIAQAQSAKVEEVKMSCVSTMAECYDTQSDALKNFDTNTAQASGAVAAYAAKSMCQDKVIACASLYGDTKNCVFDGNGKLTTANDASGTRCGLTALLAFVDTVDEVRVAEGCSTAVESYVKDLCTPSTDGDKYPWSCRKKKLGTDSDTMDAKSSASLYANVKQYAFDSCKDPNGDYQKDPTTGKYPDTAFDALPAQTRTQVYRIMDDIQEQMNEQLGEACETLNGYWVGPNVSGGTYLDAFYKTIFDNADDATKKKADGWGRCLENTEMVRCLRYNSDGNTVATFDNASKTCTFTDAWYQERCESIGGYYSQDVCYTE